MYECISLHVGVYRLGDAEHDIMVFGDTDDGWSSGTLRSAPTGLSHRGAPGHMDPVIGALECLDIAAALLEPSYIV